MHVCLYTNGQNRQYLYHDAICGHNYNAALSATDSRTPPEDWLVYLVSVAFSWSMRDFLGPHMAPEHAPMRCPILASRAPLPVLI